MLSFPKHMSLKSDHAKIMLCILFLTVMLLCRASRAEPILTNLPTTGRHGDVLTVKGHGFGSNTTFYLLEDVESGSFNPLWGSTHDLSVSDQNQRTQFSHHNG